MTRASRPRSRRRAGARRGGTCRITSVALARPSAVSSRFCGSPSTTTRPSRSIRPTVCETVGPEWPSRSLMRARRGTRCSPLRARRSSQVHLSGVNEIGHRALQGAAACRVASNLNSGFLPSCAPGAPPGARPSRVPPGPTPGVTKHGRVRIAGMPADFTIPSDLLPADGARFRCARQGSAGAGLVARPHPEAASSAPRTARRR